VVTGEIGWISAAQKGYNRVKTPLGKGQWVTIIFLPTDVHTLAAKHAAKRIVGEKGEVDFLLNIPFKQLQWPWVQTNLEVLGSAYQLTTILDRTDLRGAMVCGHEQLEGRALKTSHRFRVGSHHQALAYFLCARGYRFAVGVYLHKAQSARGVRMLPGLHEAQIGDEDPVFETSLENGLSFLRLELLFIDNQFDHNYSCFRTIQRTGLVVPGEKSS